MRQKQSLPPANEVLGKVIFSQMSRRRPLDSDTPEQRPTGQRTLEQRSPGQRTPGTEDTLDINPPQDRDPPERDPPDTANTKNK